MNCRNCYFFYNMGFLYRKQSTYYCQYLEEKSITYKLSHPDSQKCDNWQSLLQGKRNEKINKIL